MGVGYPLRRGVTFFFFASKTMIVKILCFLLWGTLIVLTVPAKANEKIKISTTGSWGVIGFRNNKVNYYRYTGHAVTYQVGLYFVLPSRIYAHADFMVNRALLLPQQSHPEFYDFHRLNFDWQGISAGLGFEPFASGKTRIGLLFGAEAQQLILKKEFKSRFYDYVIENQLQYFIYSLFATVIGDYISGKNVIGFKTMFCPVTLVRLNNEPHRFFVVASHSLVFFIRREWGKKEIEFFNENRITAFSYWSVIHRLGVNIIWKL